MSTEVKANSKVHVNGIDIYYELHGRGSPIILIAGFSCDHNFWSMMVDELAKHHQLLLLDNRGIGQTDTPDSTYTIELMATDVMGLVKILGLKSPTIVGQSMGSAIGQVIARKYPTDIDKLILINTFSQLTRLPEVVFELIRDFQHINLPLKYCVQSVVPWVYSNEFLSQPNQLQNLITLAEKNPYPQSMVGYQGQLDALKAFCSSEWLNEINAQTLVIAAEEDIIAPIAGARGVADGIGSNASLVIIPGGHASPIEQPLKTTQKILDFVKSNDI